MQVKLGNETLIVVICEDDEDDVHDDLVSCPSRWSIYLSLALCSDHHQSQHHTNRDEILMMILTMAMMIMIKPEFHSSMTADLRRSKSFVRSKPLEEI